MPSSPKNQGEKADKPDKPKRPALLLDRFPYLGTVYTTSAGTSIEQHFRLIGSDLEGQALAEAPMQFEEAEVVFGTWGLPTFDKRLLDALPNLQIIFHAAGAWESIYTKNAMERGILFSNTIDLNSRYVAKQASACIMLALKGFFASNAALRSGSSWDESIKRAHGIYRGRVGLVGYGRIGRYTADALLEEPVELMAFDPCLDSGASDATKVTPASLEAIFRNCDVVSLHLPGIPETRHMIDEQLLRLLPKGACLLNTSRGSVVDEAALALVLKDRPDLTALLDVCEEEPPKIDSPLLQLPNCWLTPHISGAIGREREHLGDAMVEESLRWLRGEPLQHVVPLRRDCTLNSL